LIYRICSVCEHIASYLCSRKEVSSDIRKGSSSSNRLRAISTKQSADLSHPFLIRISSTTITSSPNILFPLFQYCCHRFQQRRDQRRSISIQPRSDCYSLDAIFLSGLQFRPQKIQE